MWNGIWVISFVLLSVQFGILAMIMLTLQELGLQEKDFSLFSVDQSYVGMALNKPQSTTDGKQVCCVVW